MAEKPERNRKLLIREPKESEPQRWVALGTLKPGWQKNCTFASGFLVSREGVGTDQELRNCPDRGRDLM